MASEADRFFSRAEEVRAQSRLYRRQLLNWVALASAGGVAASLSFSASVGTPDYTLRLLLPSLSSFVVGLVSCGIAVILMAKESDAFEWYYLFAARRELVHEKIASHGLNTDANLPDSAARLHATANWFDRHAKRLARIGDRLVLFAAAMFILGIGYPVTVVGRQIPLQMVAVAAEVK